MQGESVDMTTLIALSNSHFLHSQFGGVNICLNHDRGYLLGARVQVQIVVVPIPAAEIATAAAAGATAVSSGAVGGAVVVSALHRLFAGENLLIWSLP